jgi:type I site-specific restriction-modification system R (restriction) subunit
LLRPQAPLRLVDFDHPAANDWLVVNQFTVIEGQHNRRPDLVVFVDGLPTFADNLFGQLLDRKIQQLQ